MNIQTIFNVRGKNRINIVNNVSRMTFKSIKKKKQNKNIGKSQE